MINSILSRLVRQSCFGHCADDNKNTRILVMAVLSWIISFLIPPVTGKFLERLAVATATFVSTLRGNCLVIKKASDLLDTHPLLPTN